MANVLISQEQLESAIEAGVRKGMKDGCICGHGGDVQYFMVRAKVAGNGNIEAGLESFAKTLAAMTRIRKAGERVGGAVFVALAVAGTMALVALMSEGLLARLWEYFRSRGAP